MASFVMRTKRSWSGLWSRRAVSTALLVFLVAVLVAPSGSAASSKSPNPSIFTVAIDREPVTADPAVAYEVPSGNIVANVYETLVKYDGSDFTKVVPGLAESWEVSKDSKVYTFRIRKGVKFHEGQTLTAHDVKYSLERAKRIGKGGAWMIENFVDKIDVLDDYTVRITLKAPFAGYLNVLTYSTHAVVSKSWVEAHGGVKDGEVNDYLTTHANGTGPFKLTRWTKGQSVVLDRFDGYWGKKANFKRVVIMNIPEPTTRAMMLKKGEADMITIEPVNVSLVQNAPGVVVSYEPTLTVHWIIMNQNQWPLSDVAVRKALIAAFPYATVKEVVYKGLIELTGQMLPKGLLGYDSSIPAPKQDLELAKKILAQAGWKDTNGDGILDKNGKPLEIEINFPSSKEERKNISVIFQAELAKIGVKLNVVGLDWPTLLAKGEQSQHQLVISGWIPDYPDPDNYMDFGLSSKHPQSMSSINNNDPDIEKWLDEARYETSAGKRAELYKKIMRAALEDATHIYIGQGKYINARREWVTGYEFNPMAQDTFFGNLGKN